MTDARIWNRENKKAKYAYEKVRHVKEEKPELAKEYHSAAMQAPERIHNSGLLQTLAFYLSKSGEKKEKEQEKKPHLKLLALHFMDWIEQESTGRHSGSEETDPWKAFVRIMDAMDSPERAMFHTQAAVSIGEWLKRFADGLLKDEKKGEVDGGRGDG